MARISVAEAASRLGVNVQRVHQRIADGSLPAERVGHQWTVEDADVARLHGRPTGRPLSARSAWVLALVAAAEVSTASEFAAPDRSRARVRLRRLLDDARELSAAQDQEAASAELAARLRSLLRGRAERRLFRASPRDLPDLRSDARVALSGISLPQAGIASADIVEGYAAASDAGALVDDFLLMDADHRSANVVLHVLDPATAWLHVVRPDHWLLMAADLAEHHRPRETARAARIVWDACAQQRVASTARVNR